MSGGLEPAERRVVLATTTAASLVPLNSTMIAVGLPELAKDLGVHRGTAAVLVTAYLVAMALCQPFAGRIGDRVGNQRTVIVALSGFALMSIAAAAAPNFSVLLGFRVAQAVFGAALSPSLQALLRSEIALGRLGRAFGGFGAGISAGAGVGPIVGGFLVDSVGWRGIFLVNAPVAAAALTLLIRLPRPVTATAEEADITEGRPLRQPAFLAACATQGLSNLAMYSVLLVLPFVLDDRGWSHSSTGLLLSGLTVGMLLPTVLGGRLGDRHGRTRPVVAGMACLIVASAYLSAVIERATPALVPGVVLMGVGIGVASASLQAAALENVPRSVSGSAAGLLSTSRYIGSIAGSLAIAVLVGERSQGVRGVLVFTTLAAVVSSATALRIEPRTRRRAVQALR